MHKHPESCTTTGRELSHRTTVVSCLQETGFVAPCAVNALFALGLHAAE